MREVTGQELIEDRSKISFAEHAASLREIHHRVKNNLQVIVSLFSLQADRTTQPQVRDKLGDMQNRVRAIAYIHEPLYSSEDFSTIHFGEYLKTFVRELGNFYDSGSRVQVQVLPADLALPIEQAVPLALISNELVSNALKHAFPGDRSGTVSVALRYSAGEHLSDGLRICELQIADDGVGLPEDLDLATAESMGLYVVRILTQQIQGTVEAFRDGGTSISIFFPLAV